MVASDVCLFTTEAMSLVHYHSTVKGKNFATSNKTLTRLLVCKSVINTKNVAKMTKFVRTNRQNKLPVVGLKAEKYSKLAGCNFILNEVGCFSLSTVSQFLVI